MRYSTSMSRPLPPTFGLRPRTSARFIVLGSLFLSLTVRALGCGARTGLESSTSSAAPQSDAANALDAASTDAAPCPDEQVGLQTLATSPSPYGITIDTTYAYWTDIANGSVMKVPLCGGQVTTLATGQAQPTAIHIQDPVLYWTDHPAGLVLREPAVGGPLSQVADEDYPLRIAVTSTDIYWTAYDTTAGGRVMKATLAGSGATTLAAVPGEPFDIALDANSVYWTDPARGMVLKAPTAVLHNLERKGLFVPRESC
jgi:hypothetical protein